MKIAIVTIVVALGTMLFANANTPVKTETSNEHLNGLSAEALYRINGYVSLFERDESGLTKAEKIARAMGMVETGGVAQKGASGEAKTIWQWMPATWKRVSREYSKATSNLDEVLPLCVVNEQIVVVWKCEQFLAKGYTPAEIGRIWNTSLGGVERPLIRKGTNKHGVRYDSEHHGNKVARAYRAICSR